MVSLGTDPWWQHITPVLEGSEHVRQTVVRNDSGTADLTLGCGERAGDLQTSLSGEPGGHLVGLELGVSW